MTGDKTPRGGAITGRLYEERYMALKRCRHGTFLYNVNDRFIGRSLDLYGEWGEAELEVLGQLIQPGQVVLDIGANIGTHAVFFAQRMQGQGMVHAFEPQRLAFQNLCANLALNAITNVQAYRAGAGDQRSMIHLPVLDPTRNQNFGAVPLHDHAAGEPVEVVRVDDLGLRACHLVKIDVEGMEARVLAGARETIQRHRPVLFVENNTVERSREIIEAILSLDYRAYWHIAAYFNPDNFFGNPENVFADFQPETNILCFHRSAPVNIAGFQQVQSVDDDWRQALARLAQP